MVKNLARTTIAEDEEEEEPADEEMLEYLALLSIPSISIEKRLKHIELHFTRF